MERKKQKKDKLERRVEIKARQRGNKPLSVKMADSENVKIRQVIHSTQVDGH